MELNTVPTHTIIKNRHGLINYHIVPVSMIYKFRFVIDVYVMNGKKDMLGYIPLTDSYFQYKVNQGREPSNIAKTLLKYFIDEFYIKEDKNRMVKYLSRIKEKDVDKKLKGMTLMGVFTESHEFTGEHIPND